MAIRLSLLIGVILSAFAGPTAFAQQAPPAQPRLASALVASLPGDAALVAVARPRQMFARTESRGGSVVTGIEYAHLRGLGPFPQAGPSMILLDYLEVALPEVAEIAYALQDVVIPKRPKPMGDDDEQLRFSARPRAIGELYLVRLNKPVDTKKARQVMYRVKEVQIAGKSYLGSGMDGEQRAMAFPDAQTVIVGSETQVRKFLTGKPAAGRLSKSLAAIQAADDLAVVIDVRKVAAFLPGPLAIAAKGTEAEVAQLAVRTGPKVAARAVVSFPNADAVDEAKGMIAAALENGKKGLEMAPPLPEDATPEMRKLLASLLDQMRKGLAAITTKSAEGKLLEIELPASAGIAIDHDYGQMAGDGKKIQLPELQRKLAELRYRPADPLAAEMQRLIPVAAGMANADFMQMATAATAPKLSDFKDQSLTLRILSDRPLPPAVAKLFPEHAKELRFGLGDIVLKPSEVAELASQTSWFGFGTLVGFNMIRRVECVAQGDQATGKAQFSEEFGWTGQVEFSARRGKDGWEISEFRWPARGTTLTKDADGLWKSKGPAGAGKGRAVKGSVLIDGKPVECDVTFYARANAERFPVEVGKDGDWQAELPPGKYVVAVRHSSLERVADPNRPGDTSDERIVEVEVPEKGEVTLPIKISSK